MIRKEYTVICDKCGEQQTYNVDTTDELYRLMCEDQWLTRSWAEFPNSNGLNRHYCKKCRK